MIEVLLIVILTALISLSVSVATSFYIYLKWFKSEEVNVKTPYDTSDGFYSNRILSDLMEDEYERKHIRR